MSTAPSPGPPATVVICTYSERRRPLLVEAIEAVLEQLRAQDELIVVVDHHPGLEGDLRHDDRFRVIANHGKQGLSGARNSGIVAAAGDVIAFLDDDACPGSTWLHDLLAPFADAGVVGVGGHVEARWETGRPTWFPPEFDWIVGCSYSGQELGEVRNPIGANMAFRRDVLHEAGLFAEELGRVGTRPMGCEETELGLRVRSKRLGTCVVIDGAAVSHFVPRDRSTPRYLLQRSYSEGLSKAGVAQLTREHEAGASGPPSEATLAPERRYLRHVANGVLGSVREATRRLQPALLLRAALAIGSVGTTALGYAVGVVTLRRSATGKA